MNTMEEQIVKLTLECRLTEAELKASSKDLAEALNKKDQHESELEAFKAQKKAEVSFLDSIINRNAVLVNSEKEFRQVECRLVYDFEGKGTKTYFRIDTGELVRTLPITNEERQTLMNGLHGGRGD